jgi:hypothetical protein
MEERVHNLVMSAMPSYGNNIDIIIHNINLQMNIVNNIVINITKNYSYLYF